MQDMMTKMNICITPEGVMEQHAGYFELPECDWEYYRNKYGDIARMDRIMKMEGTSPDHFKVSKQADTLMMFYNIPQEDIFNVLRNCGYNPPENLLRVNFDYYIGRTSHGSTLSRVVHAYLGNLMDDP